jgi:glucose-6-phosphate isomerase
VILELDYSNMMAEAVGPGQGIQETEIEGLRQSCREIHVLIEERRKRGELPFFDLPIERGVADEIMILAKQMQDRFDDIVVLGIGGSALGTTAVMRALRPAWHNLVASGRRAGLPRLFVLDNVDPDGFADHLELLDPDRTCFLVISKSGSTVETTCQFLVARDWLTTGTGRDYRDHFILITDPERGPLRALAEQQCLKSFSIPPGVGGRFSVFTPVSLLPLACAGIDIHALLDGAAAFAPHVCHAELLDNPSYLNAVLQYLAYQKGAHISVMMPYSDRLLGLADWFRQLWAESLGKKQALDGSLCHVGPTPISALGTTDQHSQVQLYMEGPFDKLVTFVAVERFDGDFEMPSFADMPAMNYLAGRSMSQLITAEQQATAAALARNGRPNCTLKVPEVSPATFGALLYMFQVQTLFAGYLFDVDPLDQPGVEEGKLFTYALMGRSGYEEKKIEYETLQSRVPRRALVVNSGRL